MNFVVGRNVNYVDMLTIKLFRFLQGAEIFLGLVLEIDDLFSTSDRVIMLEVLIVLPRKE